MRNNKFEIYLQKRGYQPRTTHGHQKLLNAYLTWCEQNELNPKEATLDDLYRYKQYHLERGVSNSTTRQHLSVLKHYFMFTKRKENPALLIKHKKRARTLPNNLLSADALKELYRNLTANTIIQRRDKVMIGMVIFQALKREELNLIELNFVNFDEAHIYVPASNRANARNIEIHPMQIKHLMEYIYEYRAKLLLLARKETNKLFFSMGRGQLMSNAIQRKTNALKKQCPIFKDLRQLKESRMALWIGEYGIRKSQYLSGIKYASSMLRYKHTDMEKLKNKLSIIHPMARLNMKNNSTFETQSN